jgi:hypothetical protein
VRAFRISALPFFFPRFSLCIRVIR